MTAYTFPFKASVAAGLGLALSLLAGASQAAENSGNPLGNMLVRDSKFELNIRSYAMQRTRPMQPDSEAWALGGWLGYQSGWLGEVFSVGLTGYTSQPLWAPADGSGTLLLGPDQQGYSVLGQAWASLRLQGQTLTGGRFEVNQAEVNPQDSRMTPNTFQGARLSGDVAGASYLLAWLTDEKTRNSTRFVNMATVAGAPAGVSSPMWLLGVDGEPLKDLKMRFSTYHVPDILNSSYLDASWLTPLSGAYQLRLGAQYMTQSSTGSDALTGSSFSTAVAGVKADLTSGAATATLAYTQAQRSAAYRTPYGSWVGYTSMIVNDFNQAGQKAVLLAGTYDFAGAGAPGLPLNAGILWSREAINASTGTTLPNQNEYDMTLDYRFTEAHWPQWAIPLWLRARMSVVVPATGGSTHDYRVILNYPLNF